MILEKIKALPDYMKPVVLKDYFNEILDLLNDKKNIEENLEALLELADRQWHTYELLDDTIRNRIDEYMIKLWNLKSKKIIDFITSIIGRLGLVKSYDLVKESLKNQVDSEIKEILNQTIKELEGHIENPYYGMNYKYP